MRGIKNRYFEGERILYGLNDANLEGITFGEGESPLKEATNITLKNSIFKWKYPLWYDENVNVGDCKIVCVRMNDSLNLFL
ncbi:hypothetical protein AYP85_03285 [Lactobacillus crispatus]|nr:hypothetical protein AYP85_03285 [Lactobacillus crispatus]